MGSRQLMVNDQVEVFPGSLALSLVWPSCGVSTGAERVAEVRARQSPSGACRVPGVFLTLARLDSNSLSPGDRKWRKALEEHYRT